MAARFSVKVALNVALDALLAVLAILAALWIAAPTGPLLASPWLFGAGAGALLLAGLPLGLPRQYWRFVGPRELLELGASSAVAAAIVGAVTALVGPRLPGPAFPALFGLSLFALLVASRLAAQVARSGRVFRRDPRDGDDTALVVGAIEDADLFLRALAQQRRPGLTVSGLLALGSRHPGRRIQGRPILGTVDETPAVLDRLQAAGELPALLVVVSPDLLGERLAALVAIADQHGIIVRRAPRVTALDQPERPPARTLDLRPVDIEDLLNRPQVSHDRDAMARLVQGRRVIVTGAGGTIGSELARQIATLGPDLLVLLDNGEYALWQIDLELAEQNPAVARRAMLADVRDERRIRDIFECLRPELVFHAAALKHVPMVEANPLDGLLTNVAGTRHVADAARAAGALAMVFISTDKAVNPTSVMGASKRMAEMYCQALDIAARHGTAGMRCITVRFGNVLGSTGSVVPLFQRQLARGGPLTVTHPDMRRYFMTVREAVGLVLQASVVGLDALRLPDAEQGGIFVLDMGEPVKIVDLARQVIRLAGLRPDIDVPIRFTGLRAGEKLYEELFHGKEPPRPTGYQGLLMAAPRTADPAIVGRAIEELAASCRSGQERLALTLLGRLVPEFEHNADGALSMVTTRP